MEEALHQRIHQGNIERNPVGFRSRVLCDSSIISKLIQFRSSHENSIVSVGFGVTLGPTFNSGKLLAHNFRGCWGGSQRLPAPGCPSPECASEPSITRTPGVSVSPGSTRAVGKVAPRAGPFGLWALGRPRSLRS